MRVAWCLVVQGCDVVVCVQHTGEETRHLGEEHKTQREEPREEEPAAGLQEIPGFHQLTN